MKIKINDVLSIQLFYQSIKDKSLPIKTAYKFSKFFEASDKSLAFYRDQIELLSDEYGKKDSRGNFIFNKDGNVEIKEDKLTECQDKLNELLNLETDLDEIYFNLDELDGVNLTIEQLQPILKFIKE